MPNKINSRLVFQFVLALGIYFAFVSVDFIAKTQDWEWYTQSETSTETNGNSSNEPSTEDTTPEKPSIYGVLSNIVSLFVAFIKGVIDSHIIIILMFFYFLRYLDESKSYRKKARERNDDLRYFLNTKNVSETENPFDIEIFGKRCEDSENRGGRSSFEKKAFERYRSIFKPLSNNLKTSKNEARNELSSEVDKKTKDKENGLQTFDFYQNKIALFGFLGTVLGLIIAVGRTKALFTGGNVSKTLGVVMPSVVEGLSIAFVTTAFSLICTILIVAAKRRFEAAHDRYIRVYHGFGTDLISSAPTPTNEKAREQLQNVTNSLTLIIDHIENLGKELGGIFERTISTPLSNAKKAITKLNEEIENLD